jgi:hypothetical protein
VKGWHYQFLIQRQAGAQWQLHLQIRLPACATLKDESGGLKAGDKQAALTQPFNEDLDVGIDYIC